MFVLDPGNKGVSVPAYRPDETAVTTASCVSVKTLANVDGPVTVRLKHTQTASTKNESTTMVFDGEIETPSKVLAIVTALFERVLETQVQGPMTRIEISVDDPNAPSIVTLHVV